MKTILTLLFSVCLIHGFTQGDALRLNHFNIKKNVALDGYDPVSYFNGKPTAGNEEITLTHKGLIYHFVSQVNLTKFKVNPEKYEPAYGGWCAYAMGETGEKVKVDPDTYKILEGKLYLFYNFWGTNTLASWNKNEKKLKAAADNSWGKIVE
jgi:YHS domain-containing protein